MPTVLGRPEGAGAMSGSMVGGKAVPWNLSTSRLATRKYSEIFGQRYERTRDPLVYHSTQAAAGGAK
jgi:hypothetical protein